MDILILLLDQFLHVIAVFSRQVDVFISKYEEAINLIHHVMAAENMRTRILPISFKRAGVGGDNVDITFKHEEGLEGTQQIKVWAIGLLDILCSWKSTKESLHMN
jgi:hypothetical protein